MSMESIEVLILFFSSFIDWFYVCMLQCMTYVLLDSNCVPLQSIKGIVRASMYNALVSLPHSALFTHTFILCHCGGFFLIGPGLGPFPPLSDSPCYIGALTALTSVLTECYCLEQNKLKLCYPVKHISLLASTQNCTLLGQKTLPHWP